MKTFIQTLALSAVLSGMAAAQVPSNVAWVRVVHGSADAPAVDVLANGSLVFQGLRFKDYTDYTPVPPGTYTFAVNPTGTQTTVLTGGPHTLSGGNAYTFYALGKVATRTLFLMGTGDDVSNPGAESTRLRVVHGASTAPTVDVYASAPFAALPAEPVLANVPFPVAGPSLTVPAGNYQARVTPTRAKIVAIDSGRLRLMGGTARTVVALDPSREGGPFELLILPDVN